MARISKGKQRYGYSADMLQENFAKSAQERFLSLGPGRAGTLGTRLKGIRVVVWRRGGAHAILPR